MSVLYCVGLNGFQSGNAYPCFCSRERLDSLRDEQKRLQLPTGYDGHCRALPGREVSERLRMGESHVIRFRV
jgi:glutamyl/glutaminyl-tRNA synthetase